MDLHVRKHRKLAALALSLLAATGSSGCGDDDVSSNEQARLAYIGLDASVGKALVLGFAGFNAASSANIPPQATTGIVTGTLTITGQVDQGASTNKGMRLRVGMVGYSDGPAQIPGQDRVVGVTYFTSEDPAGQPELVLQLRDIPNGTFTGSLVGPFRMVGDLDGVVILDLSMSGVIEEDGAGGTRRQPGTTIITGTARSADGTYQVNVTI